MAKDKFDKPSAGDKIILALLRKMKGGKKPNLKAGKKPKPALKFKRASTIASQLRKSGISQEAIDRMMGKKKP